MHLNTCSALVKPWRFGVARRHPARLQCGWAGDYHSGMSQDSQTNNERLRQLVHEAGLTQATALTIFNRGLSVGAYSLSAWKAFLADPSSVRFRPLSDELLARAERVFANLQKRAPD